MPSGGAGRNGLSSWKEVASYLGVSVRTAQHWEAQRGLPVRRLAGEKGRVWAEPEELDRWRQNNVERPRWWTSPRFLGLWAAAATAVLLVAGAVWLLSTRHGPPAGFHHESKSLVVTDEQGRELWRRTFEEPFHHTSTPEALLRCHQVWFIDIDDDGRVELLYAYDPAARENDGNILFCFSESGREKWRFVPGRGVASRLATFRPTYRVVQVMPLAPGGERTRKIVVVGTHTSRYPTQIVVLSPQGAVLGEYWHSGQLGNLELSDLDGDGHQEILLSGISNGYSTATFLVLDPNDLGGASEEENQDYQLLGFGPGREKARILFPRTCVNRKFEIYGIAGPPYVVGDSIQVVVNEKGTNTDLGVVVFYHLNRRLELTNAFVSDVFRAYHRELEAAGQLDHALTDKEVAELRKLRVLKKPGW